MGRVRTYGRNKRKYTRQLGNGAILDLIKTAAPHLLPLLGKALEPGAKVIGNKIESVLKKLVGNGMIGEGNAHQYTNRNLFFLLP